MTDGHDLFLSHNRVDAPWVERLASAVEADRQGPPLRVYFDQWDLTPGADIPLELERAIENSRFIGLVLTPEALASSWVSLERSSAIVRDPRAKHQTLIPLLRRECHPPAMLERLKYIDFRRDQDFTASLSELVATLRGQRPPRGGATSQADALFRLDAALLRQHRIAFCRPAFRVPCVWELDVDELVEAIDDTQAALNTGTLYSRAGRLLTRFPDHGEYRTPEFVAAFRRISALLTQLKRKVAEFDVFLGRHVQSQPGRVRDFYQFLMQIEWEAPRYIRKAVDRMDTVDLLRNEILTTVNTLLVKCSDEPLPLIDRSSDVIIKKSNHFGEPIRRAIRSAQR